MGHGQRRLPLILTEDGEDGRDLDGVIFVNPFEPSNDQAIDLHCRAWT